MASGSRRVPWPLLIAFGALAGGLFAAAATYYAQQMADARLEAGKRVAAIAELQADEIVRWREERLADGRFFYGNPTLGGAAPALLRDPADVAARAGVLHWLTPLKANHDYACITLADARGNVRLTVGRAVEPLDVEDRAQVDEAVRSGTIVFSDFHREPSESRPLLDLVVPLRDEGSPGSPAFGVLVFRIDPAIRLYPLIETWPPGSPSGETMLVRRDGGDVVYLNAPRHRDGAALRLRMPIADATLPAARAARGESGVVDGNDYRGVPVVAAVRGVPGSPWMIVTKIDRSEVAAPVRARALPIFMLAALLVFTMGAAVLVQARHERIVQRTERERSEADTKALRVHLDLLARHANDAIVLAGPDGRIVEANDRAVTWYGYPLAQLRGLPLRELYAPASAAVTEALLRSISGEAGSLFESVHRRKNGSTFPVEVSARTVPIQGRAYVQAIVRDITERKAAQEKIARLHRIREILGGTNQAIVRVRDRERLFEEACRIAVDVGELRMAWIGLVDHAAGTVPPVASAGHVEGYLDALRITVGDEPEGRGPVGRAFRSGLPAVVNDIARDAGMTPWREAALGRGYASAAAFPVVISGRVVAILALYASETAYFDAEEVALFEEMAADLSFAMEYLEQRSRSEAAERALAESERRHRTMIENALDIVTLLSPDGVIVFSSPSVRRVVGYAPEDLVGRAVLDFVHPDDRSRVAAAIAGGLAVPRSTEEVEFRFRHADGSWRMLHATGRNLADDPAVAGIIVNSWDVTDRVAAEERMRLQSGALAAAANGIVIARADGTIVWTNPAVTKLTGYAADELIGASPRVFKSGRHGAEFYRELWSTVLAGRTWHGEVCNRRKDGSLYDEEMSITPVRDASGSVTHFVAVKQDVTTRREDASRLAASERKFRTLFEAAGDAILLLHDGIVVDTNPAAESLFRAGRADLVGKTPFDLSPELQPSGEPSRASGLPRILAALAGTAQAFEWRHRRGDGSEFDAEIRLHRIEVDGRVMVQGAVRDITERKRAERDLLEANARLEAALRELKAAERQVIQQERLRALGTMASGVAHDFNNALVPILGFSELLLHHPEFLEDREKTRRYLESMNTAANDAGRVVARLREFYRGREDEERFAPVRLDVLAREAIALTQPRWESQAQAAGAAVEVATDLDPVAPFPGSAAELREALANLIFNALDAMPRGGTLTLRTRNDGGRSRLEIADTGIGMSEEVRQRCLEPFFTTKGEHGTGLGLSMVYGIVRRHDGAIWIDSRLGRGTTVVLSFRAANPAPLAGDPFPGPAASPRLRVLVIDDHASVRGLLGEFLAAAGHDAVAADDGRTGLEAFASGRFDLVIVDRAMPGLSGDDVAARVKATAPGTPVIMLTGFGGMMDFDGEKPPGVDVVLGKPVTMAELKRAIAGVVAPV